MVRDIFIELVHTRHTYSYQNTDIRRNKVTAEAKLQQLRESACNHCFKIRLTGASLHWQARQCQCTQIMFACTRLGVHSHPPVYPPPSPTLTCISDSILTSFLPSSSIIQTCNHMTTNRETETQRLHWERRRKTEWMREKGRKEERWKMKLGRNWASFCKGRKKSNSTKWRLACKCAALMKMYLNLTAWTSG